MNRSPGQTDQSIAEMEGPGERVSTAVFLSSVVDSPFQRTKQMARGYAPGFWKRGSQAHRAMYEDNI